MLNSLNRSIASPLRRNRVAISTVSAVTLAVGTLLGLGTPVANAADVTITVALAANPQMKTAESLISDFEAKNPGIHVKFTTLPENDLRPVVTKDVATKGGQFDVAMMGSYEVPIWAKNGWLTPIQPYADKDPSWDQADLSTPIKNIVSDKGILIAAPFYGSSSFLMYRKDLAKAAHATIPLNPTWTQVAAAAAKMNNPKGGVSGICLRGLPGWGQNLAPITTVINTFGGSWFNMKWQAQLTSARTRQAVKFYVDLLRKYGPKDAATNGWSECLQALSQGKTAMWYDDTVFAGSVIGQAATPQIADNIGFAMAPTGPGKIASGWLWSWGLGITSSSQHKDEAWKFISWVTSKDYIKLAGQKASWQDIPPGSRKSTYLISEYKTAAARYADLTIKSIQAANPLQTTVMKVPYTGVQYVQIPEFVDIGDYVSQQLAGAIAGTTTVDAALAASQKYANAAVKKAGYQK